MASTSANYQSHKSLQFVIMGLKRWHMGHFQNYSGKYVYQIVDQHFIFLKCTLHLAVMNKGREKLINNRNVSYSRFLFPTFIMPISKTNTSSPTKITIKTKNLRYYQVVRDLFNQSSLSRKNKNFKVCSVLECLCELWGEQ